MPDRFAVGQIDGADRLVQAVQDLSRARTIEEIQAVVRVAARELTGADGATFILRDGDRCYYADEDAISPLWKGMRFPMTECISGWSMIHGVTAVIEDIYQDPRIPHEAYRPTFVRSLVMVPVRKESPIGAIGNYWATHRTPAPDEVRLLEALANSTSIALENVTLFADLQAQVVERTIAETEAKAALADRLRAEEALRNAEQELRQAQKMEVMGLLAGGVVHDFNNLLSAILALSEMVQVTLEPGDPRRDDMAEIRHAGERAAELTRQLLSFSRRSPRSFEVVNVGERMRSLSRMMSRLVREGITLEISEAPGLEGIRGDAGQFDQVLLNLVINSLDAMPEHGKLRIEARNVVLDAEYAATHPTVIPGRYVMVAVSDTGSGMDAATQSRIFEPFFTTKDVEKGTGLGLSTVASIVKEAGGHIWMYSEVDVGTTFRLYFPSAGAGDMSTPVPTIDLADYSGTETVLVVEDNLQVLTVVHDVLTRFGYTVLQASTTDEAIDIHLEHDGRIDVLLTDLVLPSAGGAALAEAIASARPGIAIVYMSGYTDETMRWRGALAPGARLLEKPITAARLLRTIQEASRLRTA